MNYIELINSLNVFEKDLHKYSKLKTHIELKLFLPI